MTDEQIEKLAKYFTFLRNRIDVHRESGDRDMLDYYWTKLEAVLEVGIIFDCREELFKKYPEWEGKEC